MENILFQSNCLEAVPFNVFPLPELHENLYKGESTQNERRHAYQYPKCVMIYLFYCLRSGTESTAPAVRYGTSVQSTRAAEAMYAAMPTAHVSPSASDVIPTAFLLFPPETDISCLMVHHACKYTCYKLGDKH